MWIPTRYSTRWLVATNGSQPVSVCPKFKWAPYFAWNLMQPGHMHDTIRKRSSSIRIYLYLQAVRLVSEIIPWLPFISILSSFLSSLLNPIHERVHIGISPHTIPCCRSNHCTWTHRSCRIKGLRLILYQLEQPLMRLSRLWSFIQSQIYYNFLKSPWAWQNNRMAKRTAEEVWYMEPCVKLGCHTKLTTV